MAAGQSSERLTHVCVGHTVTPSSEATVFAADKGSVPGPDGKSLIRHAQSSIARRNLAAFDYMRSFAALVGRGAKGPQETQWRPVISLVAMTRSAVECLAMSFFILRAESAGDMLQRYVAVLEYELGRGGRDSKFEDVAGVPVDPAVVLTRMRDELVSAGIGLRQGKVGLRGVVHGLLKELHGDTSDAAAIYAQWSQIAHGESESVSALFDVDPSKPVRILADAALLRQGALTVFEANRLVDERMIAHFEPREGEVAEWRRRRAKAQEHWDLLLSRQPY